MFLRLAAAKPFGLLLSLAPGFVRQSRSLELMGVLWTALFDPRRLSFGPSVAGVGFGADGREC